MNALPAILTLLLFSIAFSCMRENGPVYPEEEWEYSTAADEGLEADRFLEALNYLEKHSLHDGISELVVVRNGRVIYAGMHADSVHNIWSSSKTFTSTVLGLLVDEDGLDLDHRAAAFEPLLEEQYPDVTFRHFTTMTSGYSARGDSRWPDARYADWSWTVYEPEAPLFPPGAAYAYWDEAQMMFGRSLTQVLGESMKAYLDRKVCAPIGFGKWEWGTEGELERVAINNGCTGVMVNALQLARWGWLFLNRGNWDGRQLISAEWVDMATTVQVPASIPVADTDRKSTVGPGCYGFNWWVNGRMADGNMKLPGAPEGCFFASGHNNNKCLVIPQWNMVIVRMGQDGHPENKDQVYGTFLQMIGNAIIE